MRQRGERSSAFVQRRVRLPESADMSKIKAAYTNGTLTLDIPKAEVCLPCLYHVVSCTSEVESAAWLWPCIGRQSDAATPSVGASMRQKHVFILAHFGFRMH